MSSENFPGLSAGLVKYLSLICHFPSTSRISEVKVGKKNTHVILAAVACWGGLVVEWADSPPLYPLEETIGDEELAVGRVKELALPPGRKSAAAAVAGEARLCGEII